MNIRLTIPGTIIAVQGHGIEIRISRKTGKHYPHGFQSDKRTKYKAKIAYMAKQQYTGEPLDEPIRMDVVAWLRRPQTHFRRIGGKVSSALKPWAALMVWCDKQIDRDNILKPIADALQGVVYVNDKTVVAGDIQKAWDDGNGERIEITITEPGRPGL